MMHLLVQDFTREFTYEISLIVSLLQLYWLIYENLVHRPKYVVCANLKKEFFGYQELVFVHVQIEMFDHTYLIALLYKREFYT